MIWNPGRYTVSLKGCVATVVGVVNERGLGINASGELNGTFVVTHIKTGRKIGKPLREVGDALRLADAFLELDVDWNMEKPALTEAEMLAVRDRILGPGYTA